MTCISQCWDERYRTKRAPTEPSQLLIEFSGLLPASGWALDLACGGGRNSVYLAERGLRVVGMDVSGEALQQGRELAAQNRVTISWVRVDLENSIFRVGAFDVVLCFDYRDPGIYSPLRHSLRPGGLLFYETYTREQLRFRVGPRNPLHLLEPGELLQVFGDWDLIFYRETWIERGVAALVARKPANCRALHSP